jgi:hypothetical protein
MTTSSTSGELSILNSSYDDMISNAVLSKAMLPIAFSSFAGCGFERNFKFTAQYFYNIFCSVVIGFDIYRIGEVISGGAKALVKGDHIGVATVLHLLKNVGIRLNSQISANARAGNVAIIISGYRKMVTDILNCFLESKQIIIAFCGRLRFKIVTD